MSNITKLRTSRPLLSLVPRFLCPIPASIYDLVKKIVRKDSKALLVSIMNYLYEAQDSALCKYVGEQLRDNVPFWDRFYGFELDLHDVSLLPQDCLSIGYFMAFIAVSCKREFRVNLESCSLGDTGIKIIMQSLCRSLDPHSKVTGHLNLHIGQNEITEKGALYVAEALRTTKALWNLNLCTTGLHYYYWGTRMSNQIGDKGLQYITEALVTNTSLVKLNLRDCSIRITEENGPILTEMLQKNKTLRKINLLAMHG